MGQVCAATPWPCFPSAATTWGDYFRHWLKMQRANSPSRLSVFHVNWFLQGLSPTANSSGPDTAKIDARLEVGG